MNDIIVNEETDILLYGLRTARQKKRMQHEDFERQLLKLSREERALSKQTRELGWLELKPPVMRGWKRYFVLRDDIARSKDAAFFQGILDKINSTDYSSRKDFKVKYRSKGKKLHAVTGQYLKNSRQLDLKKISFTPKEWSFFEEKDVPDWTGKRFHKAFVFTEPWRFLLRVRPNIITRTRVRDEAIERRLAEIDNYLDGYNLRDKISRLHGYSCHYWDWEKEKEKYRFKNMSLSQMLDAIREEKEGL